MHPQNALASLFLDIEGEEADPESEDEDAEEEEYGIKLCTSCPSSFNVPCRPFLDDHKNAGSASNANEGHSRNQAVPTTDDVEHAESITRNVQLCQWAARSHVQNVAMVVLWRRYFTA